MSGHFIVSNISAAERDEALSNGATWSALQHGNIGWTPASRALLSKALNGQAIPSREGLPPHRYLDFAQAGNPDKEKTARFLRTTTASWVSHNRLLRPTGAGLGLKQLAKKAQDAWALNKLNDALVEQFLDPQGARVTIEIYHLGGHEMT
ncbi:hypothetical protein [Streptomyces sioyaensis]|uniref:hypothetical protein n=1 Tax=Streptomyces sioyaensis TaxID=67364 RepID=UPI0037B11A3E